jgi:twitching motility protein PilT
MNFKSILLTAVKTESSDVHFVPGIPPYLRLRGDLRRVDSPLLKPQDVEDVLSAILPAKLRRRFEENRGVDFSYQLEDKARFRCVAYYQDNVPCIAMRWIPFRIPTMDELEFPPVLKNVALYPRGMVIVTGITGCGKSTTLASMLSYLNSQDARRIITIEDPIEYKFFNNKSIISQREVGTDVPDFHMGLRQSLRADPDVIMIGEMRDAETIKVAIQAAETGHLVLSTLHTTSVLGTVQRIIGHFPQEEHDLIREQMALNVRSCITQRLARTADGKGRIAAMEILVMNDVISKLIRDDRIPDIVNVMRSREDGMQNMDQALADLIIAGKLTLEEATRHCNDFYALKRYMAGVASSGDRGAIVTY